MERILEQAQKVAEAAEVFMVSTEQTPLKFENNRLKHILSKQSQTVALRIIKNGRIGYSVTTDIDDVRMLVNSAAETAAFGTEAKFAFPALGDYTQVSVYDPAIEAVSMEQMAKLGKEMIDAVRAHTPEIACDGGLTKSTTSIKILNSAGGSAGYRSSTFSMGLEGTVIQDTDMLFVGEDESSCHPLTDTRTVTSSIIRQLDWAKEQAEAPIRRCL